VIHGRDVRALALALPETTEEDHHGKPSFRVRGRIFATLPDDEHLNVMIDPMDVDGAVRRAPAVCEPLLWGNEVRGVRVHMHVATVELAGELLSAAWRRKAPRSLVPKPTS
jgi:hypothetical protein